MILKEKLKYPLIIILFVFSLTGCDLFDSNSFQLVKARILPEVSAPGDNLRFTLITVNPARTKYCSGVVYDIQKKTNNSWEVVDGHYGPCNPSIIPEIPFRETISEIFTLNETGTFRLRFLVKTDPDDEWDILMSSTFVVTDEGGQE